MGRVWLGDRAAARANLVEAERALRLFQDGSLEATAAVDPRLADAAGEGPRTIVIAAPPGDGAGYGPLFAALLGQLVAALTDTVETDAWGRVKTRRVLFAIDDPRLLGVLPLLARRARDGLRCGLELLARADTVTDASLLFGSGDWLPVFDAVVAVGLQAPKSAAALAARAGTRAVLRLRTAKPPKVWARLAPFSNRSHRPACRRQR